MFEDENTTHISLSALRSGNNSEWESAHPILWKTIWRAVRKVCPHATPSELEELATEVLTGRGKVVAQIVNPTRESFVKAVTFPDILNLAAAVARNIAIDHVRRNQTRCDEKNQERVAEWFEASTNPEDEASRREHETLLAAAVASLKDGYREVIEDFYHENLSTEEIARKRGRPKGTICVELQRARQELKEILKKDLS